MYNTFEYIGDINFFSCTGCDYGRGSNEESKSGRSINEKL